MQILKMLPHGKIAFYQNLGIVYFTERRPIHFFVKFKGFGISKKYVSELLNYDVNVDYVMFRYTNLDNQQSVYRIPLKNILTCIQYDYEGDKQYIIGTSKMQKLIGDNWQ